MSDDSKWPEDDVKWELPEGVKFKTFKRHPIKSVTTEELDDGSTKVVIAYQPISFVCTKRACYGLAAEGEDE